MKNAIRLSVLILIHSQLLTALAAAPTDPDSGEDRVVVGSSLVIGQDEVVEDAVVVGGQLDVHGRVRGDAVAVGGDLIIHPGAAVDDDAVSVGGQLSVLEGAAVGGNRVGIGSPFSKNGRDDGDAWGPWLLPGMAGSMAIIGLIGWVLRSVLLLVAALLVAFLMPDRIQRVSAYLSDNPGFSFLGALGLLFLTVPTILLLAITIVGIPLIAVVVLLLVALFIVGYTAMLTWLGERLPFLKGKTPVLTIIFGTALFMLIGLIPFFGTAFLILLSLFAAGATLMSRFGATRPSPQ